MLFSGTITKLLYFQADGSNGVVTLTDGELSTSYRILAGYSVNVEGITITFEKASQYEQFRLSVASGSISFQYARNGYSGSSTYTNYTLTPSNPLVLSTYGGYVMNVIF